MKVDFTSNEVLGVDLEGQEGATAAITDNLHLVSDGCVSCPIEQPAPIYAERAGYNTVHMPYIAVSHDWRLLLACLIILWSCTLVGAFVVIFPLGGRFIVWTVVSTIILGLVGKTGLWWRERRRNQNYVYMYL